MNPCLEVENLTLRRGERTLFTGIGFTASPGEAIALTGRNGAGKTSLLRAVAGLLRPVSGRVTLGGAEPADYAARLHLVGHLDGLKSGRTAWEELRFAAIWSGGTEATARAAATTLDLDRLLPLEVRRLSAGQRRRVALARLLAAPRPLWLLDEPLAPLDAGWRIRIGELMADHLTGGGMILAAVHDPLPVAARGVEIGA